jgi:hypothetical protein
MPGGHHLVSNQRREPVPVHSPWSPRAESNRPQPQVGAVVPGPLARGIALLGPRSSGNRESVFAGQRLHSVLPDMATYKAPYAPSGGVEPPGRPSQDQIQFRWRGHGATGRSRTVYLRTTRAAHILMCFSGRDDLPRTQVRISHQSGTGESNSVCVVPNHECYRNTCTRREVAVSSTTFD